MKKERHKELLDDDFDDYDNGDYYGSYVVPKASVGHGEFRSSNLCAQGAKSKSHSAPKEGPKLSQHNDHWEKHDYTRKIFVGGLPLTVDDVYLSRFFSTEFGPVEEEMVITLKIDDRYAMEGRVSALAMLLLVAEDRISAMVSVVIDGVGTKRSIYNSVVDEVLSIGEASARDGNEMRKVSLCEIQLLNQFGATSWRDRKVDRRSLPPLLRAAKAGDMNVTKMLLMGDVDVNETDPEGNTALHCCFSSSSSTQEPRIEWLLLKNGARVIQWNKLGLTPVHSAAAKSNYKALQSSNEEAGWTNEMGKDNDVPRTVVEDDTGLLLWAGDISRKLASSLTYSKMAAIFLLLLLLSFSQASATCDKEGAWKIAVNCLDSSTPSQPCCKTIMTSINGSVTCLCHLSTTRVMTDAGLMITELLNMSLKCGALPSSTVLPQDCLLPAPPAGAMEGLPPSPPPAARLEPPPSPTATVELPPPPPTATVELPPPPPEASLEAPPPPAGNLEVPPPPPPAGAAIPPPPPATMVESPAPAAGAAVVVPAPPAGTAVVLPSPAAGVIASGDTKEDNLYKWLFFGLLLLLFSVLLALIIMIGGPCTSRLRISLPCFSCSLERISPSSAVPVIPRDVEQSGRELAAAAARWAAAERSSAELAEAAARQVRERRELERQGAFPMERD